MVLRVVGGVQQWLVAESEECVRNKTETLKSYVSRFLQQNGCRGFLKTGTKVYIHVYVRESEECKKKVSVSVPQKKELF